MKFTQELKDKWLNALKSGEFTQGKGKLRDDNGNYCCLGVLSVICELPIGPRGFAMSNPLTNKGNYETFHEMGIPTFALAKLNDTEYSTADGPNGYQAVIPIIEKVPTQN